VPPRLFRAGEGWQTGNSDPHPNRPATSWAGILHEYEHAG